MKTNSLMILYILLIFTSCVNDETKNTVAFKKSDINGEWIHTNNSETEDESLSYVKKINFKDDFTAEIEIVDSGKYKIVSGNWEINSEKNIGTKNLNFSAEDPISLTFDRNNYQRVGLGLSVEERDNKKILSCDNLIFEKK